MMSNLTADQEALERWPVLPDTPDGPREYARATFAAGAAWQAEQPNETLSGYRTLQQALQTLRPVLLNLELTEHWAPNSPVVLALREIQSVLGNDWAPLPSVSGPLEPTLEVLAAWLSPENPTDPVVVNQAAQIVTAGYLRPPSKSTVEAILALLTGEEETP